MHLNFDSTQSTAELGMLFELLLVYSAARKRREDLLRLAVKFPNRVHNEAVSARMPDGLAPALDPELNFESSVPHYPLVSQTWVTSSHEWFVELGALDASEAWRVWCLNWPAEHLYNTCFRP